MPKAGEQLRIDPHHRASLRNRVTTDRARLRGARTSHALCLTTRPIAEGRKGPTDFSGGGDRQGRRLCILRKAPFDL